MLGYGTVPSKVVSGWQKVRVNKSAKQKAFVFDNKRYLVGRFYAEVLTRDR